MDKTNTTATITPHTDRNSFVFEPGLFGINTEVTRKGFFGGICAQMLNNRKLFMGTEGVDGWECTDYIRVIDRPEESLCRSNFVILQNGSMTQTSAMIAPETGREYEAAVWVRSISKKAVFSFGLEGAERTFEVEADGKAFHKLAFVFAGRDSRSGTFRISVKGEVAVYEASLLPTDNFYGMRRDVIENLRALHVPSVRFPGGCYADHFEWKDSLELPEFRRPVDGRSKPFMLRDSWHQDCVEVGINEFILLCREIGAEPEFTVSLLRSDGEDARKLVEYCNGGIDTEYGAIRSSLGFDAFNIKTWYIGNEPYYSGGPYRVDGGLAAKRTGELVNAMRTVDPGINAVICLVSDPGLRAWSVAFMENLDCSFEYVSYHWYYGTGPTAAPDGITACERMKRTYLHDVDEGLEFFKNELLAPVWDRCRVNVDEWNFCWGSGSNNALLISNALQLQFFARNSEKYHIREARFFMPVNEGMITVTPAGSRLESSGELFRLMAGHKGGRVIECEADTDAVDFLLTDHGDHFYLSAVNRSAAPVSLDLKGFTFAVGKEIVVRECSFTDNNYSIHETHKAEISGNSILFATFSLTTQPF